MALLSRRGMFFRTACRCQRTRTKFNLLYREVNTRTHYDVLGVARNASKGDIRSAFVALSKKHHPDVSKANNANQQFTDINEAYSVLICPSKRYQYDIQLHSNHSGPHPPFAGYSPGSSMYEYTRNYEYHTLSEEEWNELYRQSVARPNHSRVIKWLMVMMIIATAVHSLRISSAHKQFQVQHERETRKNLEMYKDIRERARNSTLEEQLERLSEAHSKTLSKRM